MKKFYDLIVFSKKKYIYEEFYDLVSSLIAFRIEILINNQFLIQTYPLHAIVVLKFIHLNN